MIFDVFVHTFSVFSFDMVETKTTHSKCTLALCLAKLDAYAERIAILLLTTHMCVEQRTKPAITTTAET